MILSKPAYYRHIPIIIENSTKWQDTNTHKQKDTSQFGSSQEFESLGSLPSQLFESWVSPTNQPLNNFLIIPFCLTLFLYIGNNTSQNVYKWPFDFHCYSKVWWSYVLICERSLHVFGELLHPTKPLWKNLSNARHKLFHPLCSFY
jgi:hypothetical protein